MQKICDKVRFFLEKSVLYFLFICFCSFENIDYKVVCVFATEITTFAYRVIVVLFITLQEYKFSNVIIPFVSVLAIFLCQCHGIYNMSSSGIVGSKYKFHSLFRVFYFTELPVSNFYIFCSSLYTLFSIMLFSG